MKKYILTLMAFFGLVTAGFTQLTIQNDAGVTYTNGDTVVYWGVVGSMIPGHAYIYNGGISISTQAACWHTNDTTNGCYYSICVGTTCYPPKHISGDFTSPAFTAPPGKDTNALYCDYNAVNLGTSIVKVVVRNKLKTDSSWVYFEFNATPTGIAPVANNLSASSLFPNPANANATFTYHSTNNAQLSIYNSLGQSVKTLELSSSKETVNINVSDMPSGIYICKLQSQGAEAIFRKLIVSH